MTMNYNLINKDEDPSRIQYRTRKHTAAEGALIIIFQLVGKIGILSPVFLPLGTNKTVKCRKHFLQPLLQPALCQSSLPFMFIKLQETNTNTYNTFGQAPTLPFGT